MSNQLPPGIDPDTLTKVFRTSGLLDNASVRDVTVENVQPTILSRIIRLRLNYSDMAVEAPRQLVLKTGLPERMNTTWMGGRQEVAFYADVAATMLNQLVPRCFHAAWDETTNHWHL